MRAGHRTAWWSLALAAALLVTTGCYGPNRRGARLAASEPTLELPADGDTIFQGDASGRSGEFVASAPGEVNLEKLGFTAERVAQAVRTSLGKVARG